MLYHTSPNEIKAIHKNGLFNDCLFFSASPYSLGDIKFIYQIDDENMNFIFASQLSDESIIEEIASDLNIDLEIAENLLQARLQVWDIEIDGDKADADWMLQAKRGECALKMGFDGCQDRDEQGTVYIIPMFEKEHILSLCKDYE